MAQMKYRKFLAQFFLDNPGMFDGWWDDDEEGQAARVEVNRLITDWENWTLRYKSRPGKGEYGLGHSEPYTIILSGDGKLNRWGEAEFHEQRPKTDFAWERAFECEGTDGQIAYIVMEDKEGNLHLGESIGD